MGKRPEAVLDVLVFAVFDCGFEPRCAMEIDDSARIRIDKIFNIINECKFSIHDISRTESDSICFLARFSIRRTARTTGIGMSQNMVVVAERRESAYG